MNSRPIVALSLALISSILPAAHGVSVASAGHPVIEGHSVVGVFEGRTPCGAIATGFTGFPARNCEKIKWRLTLYRDATTGNPTTYVFQGTRATRRGQWTIDRSAGTDGRCVLYHLSYDGPAKVLSLLAVDQDVLLLLDRDHSVLVGDASWSYALNRVDPSP